MYVFMQQQHILRAHSSMSVYLLAVASPNLLCSSSIADLVHQNQYFNIAIFNNIPKLFIIEVCILYFEM